jgi:hypothetical protein
MRRLKFIQRVVFVAILAVVIAGCSGTAATPTPTIAPSDTSVPQDAQSATEAIVPTEEAAVEETDISEAETASPEASTDEVETGDETDILTEEVTTDEPTPETEEADAPEGVTVQVSFPSSVARSGPGTSFEAVQEITVNQEFSVVAAAGEGPGLWYLVDLGDGTLAWVWSRVVVLNPPDAEVEPAATVPAS